MIKSNGPRTEPCGTPCVNGVVLELEAPLHGDIVFSISEMNHQRVETPIPILEKQDMRIS